ncbi:MAG: YwmB family TATA-box binding protein [Christensenellales bacterium]
MKKFIILVSFLVLLIFTYSSKPIFADVFLSNKFVYGNAVYSIYCLEISPKIENCSVIENGNSFVVKTNLRNAETAKKLVSNIMGESVYFDGSMLGVEKLIKFFDIEVLKSEQIENFVCLYGFAKNHNFQNSIEIEEGRVNVQIAFSQNKITIGTPIILGDY